MSGSLTVVGAGRVGLSLAADLAGDPGGRAEGPRTDPAADPLFASVAVVGRRPEPPPILAALPAVRYVRATGDGPAEGPDGAGRLLVFAVPDDRLAAVCAAWARALEGAGARPGIALHTSGLHGSDALAPLRTAGWSAGSWHPLVALAAPRRGAFAGITVGVEGEETATAMAGRVAEAVGARAVRVRPGAKALYHAGAVFGSNFLVACLSVALRELQAACEEEVGLDDLLPLARSAVENLSAGLAAGATGPVVRGDAGTVARHLEALDGETADLYRALASELLREAAYELPASARERLARALAPSG